jgi:hypothetical protein
MNQSFVDQFKNSEPSKRLQEKNDRFSHMYTFTNNNILTLNSHGSETDGKFRVNPNIFILIPNRNGLDTTDNYTLIQPKVGNTELTFEKLMYVNNHVINFKDEKNEETGWKLYFPGEEINDMLFSNFKDKEQGSNNCEAISKWKDQHISMKMIKCLARNEPNKSFCIIPCSTEVDSTSIKTYTLINDDVTNKPINRIKICGNIKLSQLCSAINEEITEPVIIIPFTCYASSQSSRKPNKSISLVNLSAPDNYLTEKKNESGIRNNMLNMIKGLYYDKIERKIERKSHDIRCNIYTNENYQYILDNILQSEFLPDFITLYPYAAGQNIERITKLFEYNILYDNYKYIVINNIITIYNTNYYTYDYHIDEDILHSIIFVENIIYTNIINRTDINTNIESINTKCETYIRNKINDFNIDGTLGHPATKTRFEDINNIANFKKIYVCNDGIYEFNQSNTLTILSTPIQLINNNGYTGNTDMKFINDNLSIDMQTRTINVVPSDSTERQAYKAKHMQYIQSLTKLELYILCSWIGKENGGFRQASETQSGIFNGINPLFVWQHISEYMWSFNTPNDKYTKIAKILIRIIEKAPVTNKNIILQRYETFTDNSTEKYNNYLKFINANKKNIIVKPTSLSTRLPSTLEEKQNPMQQVCVYILQPYMHMLDLLNYTIEYERLVTFFSIKQISNFADATGKITHIFTTYPVTMQRFDDDEHIMPSTNKFNISTTEKFWSSIGIENNNEPFDHWFKKYMKYKNKYIQLKNKLLN